MPPLPLSDVTIPNRQPCVLHLVEHDVKKKNGKTGWKKKFLKTKRLVNKALLKSVSRLTVAPWGLRSLLKKIRERRAETKEPVHLSKEGSSFICAQIPAPVAPYKAQSHANYKPRLSVILPKPSLMKQIRPRADLLRCLCVSLCVCVVGWQMTHSLRVSMHPFISSSKTVLYQ